MNLFASLNVSQLGNKWQLPCSTETEIFLISGLNGKTRKLSSFSEGEQQPMSCYERYLNFKLHSRICIAAELIHMFM